MTQPETLDFEVKFAAEDSGEVTGLASLWDQPDAFGDIIRKGAFKRSLEEHKANGTRPLFRYEHRTDEVIGVWHSISETDQGLEVKGRLVTATQRGREVHELLKAEAINGLSIGFRARGAEKGPNGARVLTDIDLVEISAVSLPAASKARITGVKSEDGKPSADPLAAFTKAVKRATKAMEKRA